MHSVSIRHGRGNKVIRNSDEKADKRRHGTRKHTCMLENKIKCVLDGGVGDLDWIHLRVCRLSQRCSLVCVLRRLETSDTKHPVTLHFVTKAEDWDRSSVFENTAMTLRLPQNV